MDSLKLRDFLGAIPRIESLEGSPQIPIGYETLLRNIESLDASVEAYKIVRMLDLMHWLEVQPDGGRALTPTGLALWKKIPSTRVIPAKQADENEWRDFKRLLGYYIECVRVSERAQDFIHHSERNLEWLVPVLPSWWANFSAEKIFADADGESFDAEAQIREFEIPTSKDSMIAAARLISVKEKPVQIFLGYPVSDVWFKKQGQTLPELSPIFTIPATVEPARMGKLRVRLNFSETRVNYEWFEYASKNNYNATGVDERIIDASTGNFKFEVALDFVSKICKNNNISLQKLDPSSLNFDLTDFKAGARKVRNTAILFVSDNLRYGKNLHKELTQIRDSSADELDKTALAYIFRKHAKPGAQLGKFGVPVGENRSRREFVFPFVPVSDAQTVATERAFSESFVVVKGPPGTGKSQVVANIIGNSVWRGESVLFTSRNHKAIESVIGKCEDVDKSVSLQAVSQNPVAFVVDDNQTWLKFADSIYDKALGTNEDLRKGSGDPEEIFKTFSARTTELAKALNEICFVNEVTNDFEIFKEHVSNVFPEEFDVLKKSVLMCADGNASEIFEELDSAKKVISFYSNVAELGRISKMFFRILKRISSREKRMAETFKKIDVEDLRKNPKLCKEILNDIEKIWNLRKKFDELFKKKSKAEGDLLKSGRWSYADISAMVKENWKTFFNEGDANERSRAFSDEFRRAFAFSRCRSLENFSKEAEEKLSECERILSRYEDKKIPEKEKREACETYAKFLKLAPAWARTSLSLWRAIPCVPAIVDRVIIDEAGQCDVASCIPALFRAKRAVVVGDPDQFPPVVDLSEARHAAAKKRFSIERNLGLFDFRKSTLYSVAERKLREACLGSRGEILLDEHFRCDEAQMAYFSDVFYSGRLRSRRKSQSTGTHGIVWHDVAGGVDAEVTETVKLLKELRETLPQGTTSFGVIAPLRDCRDKLRSAAVDAGLPVERDRSKAENTGQVTSAPDEIVISTVNGFQGGERDIIVFVLGLSEDLTSGQRWYIEGEENKYIYNVAISRAKACAHVVGNLDLARKSSLQALRKLASPPPTKRNHFDSEPEEKLYEALEKAGIATKPQFPLAGRFLDLAIPKSKLDIEVDGARWHTYPDGRRKISDDQRDFEICGAGWRVIRIWASEIYEDLDACVERVRKEMWS